MIWENVMLSKTACLVFYYFIDDIYSIYTGNYVSGQVYLKASNCTSDTISSCYSIHLTHLHFCILQIPR